ncbi:Myb-like DNA-binding domain containing protein [Tritrichomonas foetus]|uniref:Myb-like DNA-binding domain containing protein n=1 Tax=Tritrichomonas foetus TaxID=1144522 RepID=A0A1J4JPY1_9EUKA|nr:Myb-like DNA-binding domain containing protein [Tritrichomonas foetus]|eukprot:OHT01215.1 Myb-like DNA-binding domain containing protein [Tritrichomonas foetus]
MDGSDSNSCLTVLIELGLSIIESANPEVSASSYEACKNLLQNFIKNKITFDECAAALNAEVGDYDSLVRVRGILDLPEQPFPPSDSQNKLRMWTKFEDDRLIGGIYRYGLDNWGAVADFVGGCRNRSQCYQRWSRGLNPKICKKSWSPEEDQKLIELVQIFGENSWAKIASKLGNRSDIQCRYHYKQISKTTSTALNHQSNFLGLERTNPLCSTTSELFKQHEMLKHLPSTATLATLTSALTPPLTTENSSMLNNFSLGPPPNFNLNLNLNSFNQVGRIDDISMNLNNDSISPISSMVGFPDINETGIKKNWGLRGTAIALKPLPFLSPKLRLDGTTPIASCLHPIDS